MPSTALSLQEYLEALPEDRKKAMNALREVLRANLPQGFVEEMSYGMIGYVVPHSLYPAGYHCNPSLPLPFLSIAWQKNFMAVYHMGLYADPELLHWFTTEYPKHSTAKLDMGKSCMRFKKTDQIPLALLGELAAKVTPQQWITRYENQYRK
ncbi:DUF1801 domain-containing protein [Rufibacter glacialis]|uniref:DUF1801 domain-containing protein n=1 Tax=Rufibacter glacialis TaxID=1259555 RepID=A0A5M8QDZ6_9BACT|nr:DUF1801 domain-containing protein [Rufibacter glacialis]KAA6433233.1 DUF1801 domain-containing protein [Rufibacter glacialis]GGK76258.1 hypothetical protein GCM10011405_25100 [Rufibacter glacialis]